jgi:hypothetical protein
LTTSAFNTSEHNINKPTRWSPKTLKDQNSHTTVDSSQHTVEFLAMKELRDWQKKRVKCTRTTLQSPLRSGEIQNRISGTFGINFVLASTSHLGRWCLQKNGWDALQILRVVKRIEALKMNKYLHPGYFFLDSHRSTYDSGVKRTS